MAAEQPQHCAICARPSKSRCSRCKKWQFCGRDSTCAKLAWPVHRQSCRDPAPVAFSMPPLRAEHAAHLQGRSEATEVIYEPTGLRTDWFEYVEERGWYTGRKATLLKDLQQKPAACPIPEPTRSFIFLAAARPLTNPEVADAAADDNDDWYSPWFLVAQDFFAVDQMAAQLGQKMPQDVLTSLNSFLQQSVVFHALSLDDGTIEESLQGDTMQDYRWLAIERMTALAKAATVSTLVRTHLSRMIENCRFVVQFYD
ncbi:hypothetical protein JCM6882_002710 [Rhodosporidiobolus microsporus]